MDDTTRSKSRGNVPESPKKAAGAPELSQAMIEAGEETILTYGPQPDFAAPAWASSLAKRVYLAMEAVRCSKRRR